MSEKLSIGPAAKVIHVHPETLRLYAEKGLIDCSRTKGGHRRFDLSDLNRFQENTKEAAYDQLVQEFFHSSNRELHIQEGSIPRVRPKELEPLIEFGSKKLSREELFSATKNIFDADRMEREGSPVGDKIFWVDCNLRVFACFWCCQTDNSIRSSMRFIKLVDSVPTLKEAQLNCGDLVEQEKGLVIISSYSYKEKASIALAREASERLGYGKVVSVFERETEPLYLLPGFGFSSDSAEIRQRSFQKDYSDEVAFDEELRRAIEEDDPDVLVVNQPIFPTPFKRLFREAENRLVITTMVAAMDAFTPGIKALPHFFDEDLSKLVSSPFKIIDYRSPSKNEFEYDLNEYDPKDYDGLHRI